MVAQILAAVVLVEPGEEDVVGVVCYAGVGDDGVGAGGGAQRVVDLDVLDVGLNEAAEEGDVLRAVPFVVAVEVVEGEDSVAAGLEVADGELAVLVGAGDALEGHLGEGGVGEGLGVYADGHALGGLERAAFEDDAAQAQRVDLRAGGEVEGEAVEDVALVEVLDGVGEVDCVCGVGQEGVAQLDGDALAERAHHGGLFLRGRDNHLVEGVFELNVLVEPHVEAVAGEVEGSGDGRGAHVDGRRLVAGTALGTAH